MSRKLDFDVVREIAIALPDVEESTTDRGRSLKVRGRLLTCSAMHKSAEPNSLMVRISFDERTRLLAADPHTYYLTDHYLNHPAVLVRLSRIRRDALRDLLGAAWLFVNEKTTTGGHKSRKRGPAPVVDRKRRQPQRAKR